MAAPSTEVPILGVGSDRSLNGQALSPWNVAGCNAARTTHSGDEPIQ